jgi:predicted transglutaminase-like cysteine proteinase
MSTLLNILAGAVALAATMMPASAQTLASLPQATTPAVASGEARPILAWVEFCRRLPSECAVNTSEPEVIALTPRTWTTITSVGRKVNALVKPMTDEAHWGLADKWDIRKTDLVIARTSSFSSANCSSKRGFPAGPCA